MSRLPQRQVHTEHALLATHSTTATVTLLQLCDWIGTECRWQSEQQEPSGATVIACKSACLACVVDGLLGEGVIDLRVPGRRDVQGSEINQRGVGGGPQGPGLVDVASLARLRIDVDDHILLLRLRHSRSTCQGVYW